jgi:glycosyltransferase involved in cell wall biosynthesis
VPSALFVTTVASTLEAFLLPFADHLRAEGWRVDALANGAAGTAALAPHFDERFDVRWSRNPVAPSNLLGTARQVRSIVAENSYDVVHVHTPIAAFVTRYALRSLPEATRPAIIYTTHGFHFYRGQSALPHAFFRTMERIAARWTDYLVTINREDYDAARAFGTISPQRVRYIAGIGVDTSLYSPDAVSVADAAVVRASLLGDGRSGDEFLVVMVAEFGAVKRHSFALQAAALVRDPRVVIVFVGEGPLEPKVRAEADRLGVLHRVGFAGYRQDIPAVLAASDGLLLVSEREGLNRSVLEAMATGRPVFGTQTRGIADAVGADAGWITAKDDPAALASALDAAASDPDEVRRRGQAARLRAVAEFSLNHVINEYDGLYGETLASRI